MKPFFSFRISSLHQLLIFCVLSVTTVSMPTLASPIRDLQDEVTKRGISPEDVNQAMRARFPKSNFPYHEPVNGCSNPVYPRNYSWNGVFRDACNNHDRCYATPTRTKGVCDDEFLVEMSRICESAPFGSVTVCRTVGATYYKAVDEFGREYYDTAQSKQASYIRDVYDWLSTLKVTTFQTNSYINTGISIRSGDRIRIRATGTIRFGLFASSGGPNGIIIDPTYNYFVDVPHGRLMARFYRPGMGDLEGWSPIGVGWDQVREVELPAPGVLEFLVNDNEPGNNSGAFRIEITIHSGKKQ
jgi:Group XII secretory phospholipase A2 precursor (PLA2G12)